MGMEEPALGAELKLLEILVERLERASRDLAEIERRLTDSVGAQRERDRMAAIDSWRRSQ
ncbi:hypothetical protein GCM10027090_06710 [Sinomonas soli]